MTEDVIERYEIFNTKGCTDELISGNLNYKTIPSNYYNFLNDDDDDVNNISDTPVDDSLLNNGRVEYSVMPNTPGNDANDEDITNEIIIDDADSLTLVIDPL